MIWGQRSNKGQKLDNFPNIAKKHTKLILGPQGTKKSITSYPCDAPFFIYRAKRERSHALVKFIAQGVKFSKYSDLNENGLKLFSSRTFFSKIVGGLSKRLGNSIICHLDNIYDSLLSIPPSTKSQ